MENLREELLNKLNTWVDEQDGYVITIKPYPENFDGATHNLECLKYVDFKKFFDSFEYKIRFDNTFETSKQIVINMKLVSTLLNKQVDAKGELNYEINVNGDIDFNVADDHFTDNLYSLINDIANEYLEVNFNINTLEGNELFVETDDFVMQVYGDIIDEWLETIKDTILEKYQEI